MCSASPSTRPRSRDCSPTNRRRWAPIGGPNPSRLLAAAVANCLSASLLFAHAQIQECAGHPRHPCASPAGAQRRRAPARGAYRREPSTLPEGGGDYRQIEHLLQQFENFCVVTESVRQGWRWMCRCATAAASVLHDSAAQRLSALPAAARLPGRGDDSATGATAQPGQRQRSSMATARPGWCPGHGQPHHRAHERHARSPRPASPAPRPACAPARVSRVSAAAACLRLARVSANTPGSKRHEHGGAALRGCAAVASSQP